MQTHTGTFVSHSQHRKNLGEVLAKEKNNAGEWTRRIEISKKSLAAGVACVAIYAPAVGFKGIKNL